MTDDVAESDKRSALGGYTVLDCFAEAANGGVLRFSPTNFHGIACPSSEEQSQIVAVRVEDEGGRLRSARRPQVLT
ncbi:MAG: hypothetical protein ABWK05_00410 [Pyrobaculum sp.]